MKILRGFMRLRRWLVISCSSKGGSASLRSNNSTAPRNNARQLWLRHAGRVASSARSAAASRLSGDDPQSLSVHQVPPADVADCRDDLCLDTSGAAAMVSRYLSPDPDQARHLQHRTGSSPWGDADHRLESQTQVEAGHA